MGPPSTRVQAIRLAGEAIRLAGVRLGAAVIAAEKLPAAPIAPTQPNSHYRTLTNPSILLSRARRLKGFAIGTPRHH